MKKIGIAFSSKDRVEFTRRTLPQLLKYRDRNDVHWVDGSVTEEGIAETKAHEVDHLHLGIGGGADVAIVYSLSVLLDKGYEYVGLLENDVLLADGWFEKVMPLFERTDMKVGGVSARCYADRILVPCGNFAIMSNVGAGMQILRREAAECVLKHYRNGSFGEFSFWPTYFTGQRPLIPHEIEAIGNKPSFLTADWFFESSYMRYGMVCLAPTPSVARNIDGIEQKDQTGPTKADPMFMMDKFLANLGRPKVAPAFGNFDPAFQFHQANLHQMMVALPDSLSGSWKLWWAKHNGPFGLVTTKGDESLMLPFTGTKLSILMETKEKVTIHGRIASGTSILEAEPQPGLQWVQMSLGEFDFHEIELSFDRPGVKIATIGFDNPQPWMRDGYPLTYETLRPYLKVS